MSAAVVERNLTDFLRKSGEVLREVDDHDVLLRRRDGSDLMLVRADRHQQVRQTVGLSSGLLSLLASEHATQLTELLPGLLPWMRFLPEGEQHQFAEQFVETLVACASLDSYAHLTILLQQWENTAYVWSRPDLLEALRADQSDDGYDEPVPAPAA